MPTVETLIEQLHEDIRKLDPQPVPIPQEHKPRFAGFVTKLMKDVNEKYKSSPLTGSWPVQLDEGGAYIQKDWIDHDFRHGGLHIIATIPFDDGVAQISIREDDPENNVVVRAFLPTGEIDFKFV